MNAAKNGPGRITTIGHSNRELEDLLLQLESEKIAFVADVRSRPYSRRLPHFSKDLFAHSLARRGIRYAFFGDLLGGQPDDPTCYFPNGQVNYEECRLREPFQLGISRLLDAHRQGLSVCLVCSEGKPHECHRSKLIGVVLAAEGVEVEHLLVDGTVSNQTNVMLRVKPPQFDLFGASVAETRSRGKYPKKGQ